MEIRPFTWLIEKINSLHVEEEMDPTEKARLEFKNYINNGKVGDRARLLLWGQNEIEGKITSRRTHPRDSIGPAFDTVTVEIYPNSGNPVQHLKFYTFENFADDNHQILIDQS